MRALLTHLIDYAGLFPPASLSLDAAIRQYARHRREPDAWMLGSFICPADKLKDLAPYSTSLFTDHPPFTFTVLGRSGKSAVEFLRNLETDVADIAAFRHAHSSRAAVIGYETRLPHELDNLENILGQMRDRLATADRTDLSLFLETPHHQAPLVAPIIAQHNRRSGTHWGYKLRCGGIDANAFPSVENIAQTILACRDVSCPMKCTAGLHHPIRHYREEVKTKMHGFINVFAAGVLAKVHNLTAPQLNLILADEDPHHFHVSDGSISWDKLTATAEQVADARKQLMIAFGSCSFDEPRDDLRHLHWLPPAPVHSA